ncbi:hypothetical protein KSS87_015830 [Heliosperma pusillum]|nr:hypothetical protein KSS87_015830 [Heliosperma pusillum]
MESQPHELINEVHVIVVPYPIQGHINPMLQFSKQLASRGLKVTLATTLAFSSKFTHSEHSISIETISDGNNANENTNSKNIAAYTEKFDLIAPQSLAQLIETKIELGHNIKCIIYDSVLPWGLEVARKYGVYGASFITQSCIVSLIYYQVYKGILRAPIQEPWQGVFTNDTPLLIEAREMPSFVYQVGLYPSLEKFVLNQFRNYGQADWRFFNTIDHLECEIILDVKSINESNPAQPFNLPSKTPELTGLDPTIQPHAPICRIGSGLVQSALDYAWV